MGSQQPLREDGTMICRACGTAKAATLENFKPSRNTKSGMNATCRLCMQAYHTRWRTAHRETSAARRRELYAQKHAAEQARIAAERLALGPVRLAHEAELQRVRHARRLQQRPLKARASIMRSGMLTRSRIRGLPFDAETFTSAYLMEWIEQTPTCPCCGVVIDYGYKDGKLSDVSPSIDRFIPVLGYVLGNVALICWRCNNLKRNATADELEAVARWMRTHTAGSH